MLMARSLPPTAITRSRPTELATAYIVVPVCHRTHRTLMRPHRTGSIVDKDGTCVTGMREGMA
jgi:hypothetical protein